MNNGGFKKLYWGIFFVMFNFRIQGFDILPDIVGYIFLALGFSALKPSSDYFDSAAKYNIPMILFSVLSIFLKPVQIEDISLGIGVGFSMLIAIATFVLNLLVFYNMFMGIKEMAEKQEKYNIAQESEERWKQYKWLQIAGIIAFILIFIPPIMLIYAFALFVITIALTISILRFINKCNEGLYTENSEFF